MGNYREPKPTQSRADRVWLIRATRSEIVAFEADLTDQLSGIPALGVDPIDQLSGISKF